VRTTNVDDVVTVSGAPETVLGLQEEGLVSPAGATVIAGEENWDAEPDVVTDAPMRRERAFGRVGDALSTVLGPDEAFRVARATHDYPTAPGAEPVSATYGGLRALTASSSQGYADTYGP